MIRITHSRLCCRDFFEFRYKYSMKFMPSVLQQQNFRQKMQQYSTNLCGKCFQFRSEELQQNNSNECLLQQTTQRAKSPKNNKVQNTSSKIMSKNIFSFKENYFKVKSQDFKNNLANSIYKQSSCSSNQFGKNCKQTTPLRHTKHFSPEIKFKYSPSSKIVQRNSPPNSCMHSFSPRSQRLPKISFKFNVQNGLHKIYKSKIIGQPLNIIEQQTQYSSKQSQLLIKYGTDNVQNNPRNAAGIFQQIERKNNNTERQSFSSINQSQKINNMEEKCYSQRGESRIQTQNPFLSNNSAVTPTTPKLISKDLNKQQNIGFLHEFKESVKVNHTSVFASPVLSPRDKESPRKIAFNDDPNLFYSQQYRLKYSPKISVLNLQQRSYIKSNDYEQELKDIIDHNFLISHQPSHANSPKISERSSHKNIPQLFDSSCKRQVFNSPQHSRENSWQTGLLNSGRLNIRRTNTIFNSNESLNSQISIVDMKFRLKHQGRRQYSRLISH